MPAVTAEVDPAFPAAAYPAALDGAAAVSSSSSLSSSSSPTAADARSFLLHDRSSVFEACPGASKIAPRLLRVGWTGVEQVRERARRRISFSPLLLL